MAAPAVGRDDGDVVGLAVGDLVPVPVDSVDWEVTVTMVPLPVEVGPVPVVVVGVVTVVLEALVVMETVVDVHEVEDDLVDDSDEEEDEDDEEDEEDDVGSVDVDDDVDEVDDWVLLVAVYVGVQSLAGRVNVPLALPEAPYTTQFFSQAASPLVADVCQQKAG
jgi:hypothetical protein